MSLIEQIRILRREAQQRMGSMATTVLLTSLVMLALGLLWTEQFESSATILVEEQKIIAPLMEGATVPTSVRDQADLAREVLYSRDVMNEVLEKGGWLTGEETPSPIEREEMIEQLKGKLEVINVGDNLIELSFRDPSPERAFRTVLQLSNLFITHARSSKYEESQAAYEFISSEAERYRGKLSESEKRLQDFLAKNGNIKPGTGEMVDDRVIELMRQAQSTALDLEEARVRVRSLESQLSDESSTTSIITREEQLISMIAGLQNELATLRLQYHDTYPDIISIKHQIAALEDQLETARRQREEGILQAGTGGGDGILINPLHQELRGELSMARTQVAALEKRLERSQEWLSDAQGRGVEIGGVEAQAAELTREYEVTKQIYEDLLKRRESARMAVNLDADGEGLTMSIQEPPTVPLSPSGIRFVHFAMLGPFLGVGLALTLLYARVRFDERIRSGSVISRDLQIPVLATVPMLIDERARGRVRRVRGSVIAAAMMLLACYALVAALRMNDFI